VPERNAVNNGIVSTYFSVIVCVSRNVLKHIPVYRNRCVFVLFYRLKIAFYVKEASVLVVPAVCLLWYSCIVHVTFLS